MIYHGFDVQPKKRSKKNSRSCGIERAFTAAYDCFSLARSTIAHHFKELQNADLIHCERRGQSFYCEVYPKALEAMKQFMD
jgi:DNA-binding transcriptional ArsR family regulator